MRRTHNLMCPPLPVSFPFRHPVWHGSSSLRDGYFRGICRQISGRSSWRRPRAVRNSAGTSLPERWL